MTALNPPIELLERTRWKDRDTFIVAPYIHGRIDKLRRSRKLEISDEHISGFVNKIADHLADMMEPGAEFLLVAYQPPRTQKEHKHPPSFRRSARGKAKLWKELVAREHQARIEICVFVKGGKAPDIIFFEPVSADKEFENMIEEEFYP